MTADRWTELEALAKAATPGPWEAVEGVTSDSWWVERPRISTIVGDPTAPDARFIAAANPQTIRDLIAAAREHREKWQAAERRATQAVARVAELEIQQAAVNAALARHPRACDTYGEDEPIKCGWKRAVADIEKALEVEP